MMAKFISDLKERFSFSLKKFFKRHKILWIGLLLELLCFGLFFACLRFMPCDEFCKQTEATIPKFDALNEDVFATLSHPTGTKLISKQLTGYYGRKLVAKYSRPGTFTSNDVDKFYDTLLRSHGWDFFGQNMGNLYTKKTACVEIVAYLRIEEYDIRILHDFWAQDFIPSSILYHANLLSPVNPTFCPPLNGFKMTYP